MSVSDATATVTHSHCRERTSRHPAASSASIVLRRAGSPRARGFTRARNQTDTRKLTASNANAVPALNATTSTVASAGPSRAAVWRHQPVAHRAHGLADPELAELWVGEDARVPDPAPGRGHAAAALVLR